MGLVLLPGLCELPPFRLEEENFIFNGSPQQEHLWLLATSFSRCAKEESSVLLEVSSDNWILESS